MYKLVDLYDKYNSILPISVLIFGWFTELATPFSHKLSHKINGLVFKEFKEYCPDNSNPIVSFP